MREKVAYLATVSEIKDIEGKDKIKYVSLDNLGWEIIHNIEASPIKVGDRVVYIEYDTVITPHKAFEYLRQRCWSEKVQGFKLRAMKMAGVVSYGLICPVTIVEQYGKKTSDILKKKDGFDLSKVLKIKAWDDLLEEMNAERRKLSKWKYFLFRIKRFFFKPAFSEEYQSKAAIKTDETRIENLLKYFESLKNVIVYTTLKIDGQSLTASIFKDKFYVMSRNKTLYCYPVNKALTELTPEKEEKQPNAYLRMTCKYSLPLKIKEWMEKNNKDCFTIQGESAGPGIQQNKLGLEENKLFLFNAFDPESGKYYSWKVLEEFALSSHIPTVDFIEKRKFDWKDIKELKEYSKGNYENGYPREGIVIRTWTDEEKYDKMISFKCINPDFDAKQA